MKNKYFKCICSLALVTPFIIGTPTIIFASDDLKPVTLQEVIEDITSTDPNILESLSVYQSVLAERAIARSGYYPTVGTTITAGPERTEGVDTGEEEVDLISKDASLYVRQNLFSGGETTAFVNETEARITAAAYNVLATANSVYLDTIESYIGVIKSRDLLAIAQTNAETQEKIMRQVREKTDQGFSPVSELYNSESRLALSKGSLISRQQDLNQAIVSFHKRFGRLLAPSQFIMPEPTIQLPGTVEQTVELAFMVHPALKVAEFNIEKSRYSFERSESKDLPTLDLELRGQYEDDTGGSEGDTTTLGAYLTLNYTFYDGGLRSGEQQRDKLSIHKENQRSYIERRNVNETVRRAWNIHESEDFKNAFLSEHVQLSDKTLQAFKEEYYVGRRTLLDLLNMENEVTDAQLSFSESEFSNLISIYRLLQATGMLLEEYDMGLRSKLELPEADYASVFETMEAEEVDAYESISLNRDADAVQDKVDQCDNSSDGAMGYGCDNTDVNITGYNVDTDALGEYISPDSFQDAGSEMVNIQEMDVVEEIAFYDVATTLNNLPDIPELTPDSAKKLARYVDKILGVPSGDKVLLEGYVASNYNTPENIELSLNRCKLVRDILVKAGVDESIIIIDGKGNTNPIGDNNTREGRKLNRRVEISLLKE